MRLVARVVRRYRAEQSARWATSISWNALFAFIPIVLVLVTLFSLLLRHRGFAGAVEVRIISLGQSAADRADIRAALTAVRDRTGLLAVVSFLGLLWSGGALFSAMDDALSHLYGVRSRPFFRKRLMAVGMIFVFTVLLIPLLVSSTLLSVSSRISILPAGFPGGLALALQVVIGALDGTLIYAAIYYVVPHRRQRLLRVLPGAALAGTLLEAFTLLFPAYIRATNGLQSYGAVFSLVLVLITYFFFLGQVTMLGALVNVEREPLRPPPVVPAA
ncbi:MAG: YihY/virulence factor BrkB family protein [Candidatus Dormibacteraeota bacterium]|nr:YihY/virulence factor BrkB family protein [Candidatus Dormibacteraeota bacterium]MBV9524935.1 YihY/virulence factor BrkB family protein [Candidatus Dormibacteraeota bacterium]